jgi:hypothetical protein
MARSGTSGADAVEVGKLDFGEVLLALGHSSIRRARLLADLGQDLIQNRRSAGQAVRRWVDGNESDLEELTLRWRLAGVRWPIVILLALTFVAGYQAGRRAGR